MSGLLILLVFLLTGISLQTWLDLPVPGSIVGMLTLLFVLMLLRRTPETLQSTSRVLSPLLPLFIIPVSVGIITQKELLNEHGIALLIILAVSLLPGALVCAFIMTKRSDS